MGNLVGKVRQSIPAELFSISSIEQQQTSDDSAACEVLGLGATNSALFDVPRRTSRNSSVPKAIQPTPFPLLKLQNDHPELVPLVVSNLNLAGAKALRLTNKAFKASAASRFTQLAVVDATKISNMAELVVDANNAYSIRIVDKANFGDQELAQLVAMMPDKGVAIRQLDLSRCANITSAGLQHIQGLTALQSLNLSCCYNITGAGLNHLSSLTAIQSLDLSDCHRVTDAGLNPLSSLTTLQSLNLNGCHINDVELSHLSSLTALRSLNLSSCCNITDAGLNHLSSSTTLQSLNLSFCYNNINDAGLNHLSRLTALQSLNLRGSRQITDAGLNHLSSSTTLQSLNFGGCYEITDIGLNHLSSMTALQSLNLSGCHITDVGLYHLSSLTTLQILNLNFCGQFSKNYITQIRKSGAAFAHQISHIT
jgi:hypothetical protein